MVMAAESGQMRSPTLEHASVAAGRPVSSSLPPLTARAGVAALEARALFDAHYDFVWRSLRGLGVRPGSLDDGAQQVFWLAFRKLDTIVPGSERPFLFRLATGVASNLRRTARRTREVDAEGMLDARADTAPDPEEAACRRQARELLEAALGWLPGDLRVVFVLFELEELEIPEIAACLDIPIGTVGSRLRRAREKFQVALRRLRRPASAGRSP
jgi:RNA polymerase sigma-70 factor (ECF subfamily)